MKLTIEDLRGVWRAQIGSHTEFAETLEELLLKLAPAAPEAYVWHAAEVLGAILGAEVVEVQQPRPGSGFDLFDMLTGLSDEEIAADIAEAARYAAEDDDEPEYVDENWHPTDAQRAYFEPQPVESLLDEDDFAVIREDSEDDDGA